MSVQQERQEEFEAFYHRYHALVRHVLYSVKGTRYHNDLEDLVSETFLKAWKAYESIKHQRNVTAWICQVARNTLRDHIRHARLFWVADCEWPDGLEEEVESSIPEDCPESLLQDKETLQRAQSILEQMSPEDQTICTALWAGYKPVEIQKRMGMSRDSGLAKIRRTRNRFQRLWFREVG